MGRSYVKNDRIQWTGDNMAEMILFHPWLVEWPYYYKNWPMIRVIGYKQDNKYVKLYMRDTLYRTKFGRYLQITDLDCYDREENG